MLKTIFKILWINILILNTRSRINNNSLEVTTGMIDGLSYVKENDLLWNTLIERREHRTNLLKELNGKR